MYHTYIVCFIQIFNILYVYVIGDRDRDKDMDFRCIGVTLVGGI